jgi:hypothetical protein
LFDWFRKLFRNKERKEDRLSKVEEKDVQVSLKEIREGRSRTFTSADELIRDLHKARGYAKIAELNRKRQKSTLGYGLKSRNFKPRSGFEKRQWDVSKKPDDVD